jgi:hypothetical protein
VIAQHKRSYDRAKQIECEEHIKTLALLKRQARLSRGQDRLTHSIDCARSFLEAAAESGYSLKSITRQLTSLLDDYGANLLEKAMTEALEKKVPHPNSVRIALQRFRDASEEEPLVRVALSHDERVTDMVIKPHSLNQYDVLSQTTPAEEHTQ